MSATLAYIPVTPVKNKYLGGKTDKIRFILTKKYTLNEGVHILKTHDICYLQGLKDAGFHEVHKLIEDINTYGEVKIFLEH